MKSLENTSRVLWIDFAKAYGMILVFYAHFVERYTIITHSHASLIEYRFIYSFHVPLFFFLSGYVTKSLNISVTDAILRIVKKRIIPILFFNILVIPLWFIFDNAEHEHISLWVVAHKAIRTFIAGHPELNTITWFIVCLAVLEIVDYVANIYFTKRIIYRYVVIMYIMGFIVAYKLYCVTEATGIMKNFWFIHTALVAYPLYTLGKIIKESRVVIDNSKLIIVCLLAISGIITYITCRLNQLGPFGVVLMYGDSYGNPILFTVTAITGSTSIILLSMLTPRNIILNFIGNNSIFFLGLNGIFFSFVNHRIVKLLIPMLPDNNVSIFCASSLVTIGSLAICFPATLLLRSIYPCIEEAILSKCESAKNIICKEMVT